jgi:hypothetical protein
MASVLKSDLRNSEFGGFARGTKATNLLAFGSLLRLAAAAASPAESTLAGLAT